MMMMNRDTQIKTSGFYREAETSDDEATARSDDIETGKSENVKSEYGNAEIHDVAPHSINELVVSQCKKRKAYTRKTGNKFARLSELPHYNYVDVLHIFD